MMMPTMIDVESHSERCWCGASCRGGDESGSDEDMFSSYFAFTS